MLSSFSGFSEAKCGQVAIPASATTVELLLQYLYGSAEARFFSLTQDDLFSLLRLATVYDLESLRDLLAQYMIETLSVGSAVRGRPTVRALSWPCPLAPSIHAGSPFGATAPATHVLTHCIGAVMKFATTHSANDAGEMWGQLERAARAYINDNFHLFLLDSDVVLRSLLDLEARELLPPMLRVCASARNMRLIAAAAGVFHEWISELSASGAQRVSDTLAEIAALPEASLCTTHTFELPQLLRFEEQSTELMCSVRLALPNPCGPTKPSRLLTGGRAAQGSLTWQLTLTQLDESLDVGLSVSKLSCLPIRVEAEVCLQSDHLSEARQGAP